MTEERHNVVSHTPPPIMRKSSWSRALLSTDILRGRTEREEVQTVGRFMCGYGSVLNYGWERFMLELVDYWRVGWLRGCERRSMAEVVGRNTDTARRSVPRRCDDGCRLEIIHSVQFCISAVDIRIL